MNKESKKGPIFQVSGEGGGELRDALGGVASLLTEPDRQSHRGKGPGLFGGEGGEEMRTLPKKKGGPKRTENFRPPEFIQAETTRKRPFCERGVQKGMRERKKRDATTKRGEH